MTRKDTTPAEAGINHSGRPPNFSVEDFLSSAGKGKEMVTFAKGDRIFAHDQGGGTFFYILEGVVRLTVSSEGEDEPVLAILHPGDFIGENCLFESGSPTCCASAETVCVLMKLDRALVRDTLAVQPALAERLITYVLRRTMQIEKDFFNGFSPDAGMPLSAAAGF